jgi:hypothetical protein
MAKLFGRSLTRSQILSYVGDISQIAGVKLGEWVDGNERGLRTAEVRSGSGLRFTILLDRGMDIGPADYRGVSLGWISHVGFADPSYFEAEGLGWLYGFGGGLLTGCGMTYLGAPNVDNGESLGQHGRLSFIPAQKIHAGEEWQGDECTIFVEGEVRQARVHGEYLSLNRRISTLLGSNTIRVEDTVDNLASKPSPLMMLYHVNVGYPMLNENSYLVAKTHKVVSRDAAAEVGISNWDHFQTPTPAYDEQVFYHDIPADADGWATIDLISPDIGRKFTLRYLKDALFNLVQWKMMGAGTYVLGLEPANCHVDGRSKERARGTLQTILPGEQRRFAIEITIVETQ